MEESWDKVVELYEGNPESHMTQLSISGYTALHVAVVDGKEAIVKKLVNSIKVKKTDKALDIQNKEGNTPLHLAAFMGSVKMCQIILDENNSHNETPSYHHLLEIENEKGETPIFMAALHGKMDVFLYLNQALLKNKESPREALTSCRRNDGDTILHCAINGEYFGKYILGKKEKKKKEKKI